MKAYIYPYRTGSNSVSELRRSLKSLIIRAEGSKFVGNPSKTVINWGNSVDNTQVDKCNTLNPPSKIRGVTNKLDFFKLAKGSVNIPEFTTNIREAKAWLDDSNPVVCRSVLTGHSGNGITVVEDETDWGNLNHSSIKVYTKYIPKESEWRVHIFQGDIFDVQKKSFMSGKTPRSFRVQNRNNGFVYTRDNFSGAPKEVIEQALAAIKVSGLDFGAVDVVFNKYREKAFVLEINTAPGLEGTTLQRYVEVFSKYLGVTPEKAEGPRTRARREYEEVIRQVEATRSGSGIRLNPQSRYLQTAVEDDF